MPVEVGDNIIYSHYLEFFLNIHMLGWCRISEAKAVCCWRVLFLGGINMEKNVYPWPIDPSMRPEFDDGM